MNPLDEIEMELGGKVRVGQRVRTRDGLEGVTVEQSLLCPWQWWVTIGRCTALYDADTLIPLPEPDPWLERVLLITYPELFICSKAGECKKCLCANDHKVPHEHYTACKVDCPFVQARCIPYVPEDEADWFICLGPPHHRYAKEKATQYVKDNPGYRAFRWSDGLKGAPCE